MIPRIFHFSVPSPMTEQQATVIEIARRLHPHWDIKIWNDLTPIENARLGRYRNSARSGAQRADLIRLDAVYAYGGVYLDADIKVLKPFDDLIKNYDFFMGCEDGRNLTNALIGTTPKHSAIEAVINFLEENEPDWSLPPNETTGPMLFARLLGWRSDVEILPRETFYPYNWNDSDRRVHRLSYSEHLWDKSWGEKDEKPAIPHRSLIGEAKAVAKRAMRPMLAAGLSGIRRAKMAAEPALRGFPKMLPITSYSCTAEIVASTAHGNKIVLDGGDLSITPNMVIYGSHEWSEEAFVRRILRGGDWFVDVGANVGVFTILAASRCGPLGRVLAFEPNPHVRSLLSKSAVMNWYHDRIKVFDVALGDDNRTGILSYFPNRLGDAQMDVEEKGAQPFRLTGEFLKRSEIEVPVRKLDDIIPVDLPIKIMKIDAEGHEPKVLEGSRRLLGSQAFDFILLEVSAELFTENWKETVESLRMLIDLGYSAGRLDEDGFLIKYSSLNEALARSNDAKTLVFAAS